MFDFLSPTHWLLCTSPSSSSEKKEKIKDFSRTLKELYYYFQVQCSKCSNTSNRSCLALKPRQTGQTQIRLLLFRSSLIRVFPVCFCEFQP